MNKAGKIIAVNPPRAVPGGELIIECEGFQIGGENVDYGCFFDNQPARITGASAERILVNVPENADSTKVSVTLEAGGAKSEPFEITVGKKLADDMHIVANPAIDPKDDSIILTRSGSRGQHLPVTLFRLGKDGFLDEMIANIMNPTGIAFNESGEMFVTNRAEGEVSLVTADSEAVSYAANLGIATGIAFDKSGAMYVGDRSGAIYRVAGFGAAEVFASIEPSVAAYHLAFGADERLYVTAPGLASFDAVYAIDKEGYDEVFYRGLGRPQGLAFDRDGNLYVAACLAGRRGIVKITPDGEKAELFVAGMNFVGLCFSREGEMIAATNEAIYSLPVGIYGTLLE
jgi:DNA-binding beta-propeller fold protein YncE